MLKLQNEEGGWQDLHSSFKPQCTLVLTLSLSFRTPPPPPPPVTNHRGQREHKLQITVSAGFKVNENPQGFSQVLTL